MGQAKKGITLPKIILLVVVLFSGLLPVTVYGATPEQWGSYDIRTKPNSALTAELLDKVFADAGKGGVLVGMGGAVIEAGEKNGINPGILAGMIIHETGWGKSSLAKNNNNLGGVKCKPTFECRNGFTVFESPAHSIQVQAELLAGKTYVGAGLVTFKQILERYAPPSDGNTLYGSGGYISAVGTTMEVRFLQTVDGGETLVGSGGDYTAGGNGGGNGIGGETKVGGWQKYDFFMESQSVYNGVGVDAANTTLPADISYGFQVFSEKTYKILIVVGVYMAVALITYMAVTILLYVAIVKEVTYKTDWFSKLSRIDGDVRSRETVFALVGRMVIGVVIITLFMSGLYVDLMARIYTLLETVGSYIF